MKGLLIVPLLVLSLPGVAYAFAGELGAHTAAYHHTHSPSTPSASIDVVEGKTELPTPCGMEHCVDMVGCTGAGTAVGAHAANLPTWTVAAPGDAPLVLTFQTVTRTAVPPPPRI